MCGEGGGLGGSEVSPVQLLCAYLFEVGLEAAWEFVGFADGKLSGVGVEFGRADEKRERESEFESAVVK